MIDKAFGKYDCDGDRADVWFRALAYVYQATSRSTRKKASKHASALRLLYKQGVDADQIAATIEKRGGIQKLADAAAKDRRKGPKQSVGEDDAEPEGEGRDDEDAESVDAEGDQTVRLSISGELKAKIRRCRGNRVKIIASVPKKKYQPIEVLKVFKLKEA